MSLSFPWWGLLSTHHEVFAVRHSLSVVPQQTYGVDKNTVAVGGVANDLGLTTTPLERFDA